VLTPIHILSKERQGVLIAAYVQYCVEDFAQAYKKLDFSDADDPMQIVNIQLREQCEASIKDKVATLTIDDVLTDKRPIVEELTSRLRSVSDGQGLKIVQVQIKEAVVSSASLWETLQKPFREKQGEVARLSQLDSQKVIRKRELEDSFESQRDANASALESEKMKRMREVELSKARALLEEQRVTAESAQIEAQAKLDLARHQAKYEDLQRENAYKLMEAQAATERQVLQLKVEQERIRIQGMITNQQLADSLIKQLPEILGKMPKPDHSMQIISGDGKIGAVPESILSLAGLFRMAKSFTEDKQ
jgi:hypothetical protein